MRTLSSFLGREVVTESGTKLGHCHDLRAEATAGGLEVTALLVGPTALAEHYRLRSRRRHDEVPWSAVVKIEGSRIVVRDEG